MNGEKTISTYHKEVSFLREVGERLLHLLFGVIVCRGIIFSGLAPFGASYVSAVPKKQLFWATLGTALGYIILKPDDAFRYVAVTVAISLARWMFQDLKNITRSMLYAPAIAFVPMFSSGIVMMFVSTSTISDLALVTVESVLSATVAFFISRSLFLVNSRRKITTFSQSEMASIIMCGCVVMLSVGNIQFEGVSLGRIFSVIIILLCARYGSVVGGTISGVATGSVFGLGSQGYAFLCAGYSFGGLVGGLLAPLGKAAVSVGFVICNSIMSFSSGKDEMIMPLFAEALIGSAVFMILPKSLEKYITPLFLPKENSKSGLAVRNSLVMRLDFAANALKNVNSCVDSVSRQLKKLHAPDDGSIYEATAIEVCKNCGLRGYCWEKEKYVTKEDFTRLSAPLKSQGFVTENDVVNLFSKKCCRSLEISDSLSRHYRDYLHGLEASQRVAQIRSMVAGQFAGLSEILSDMAVEFENYKSYDPDTSARVMEYLHSAGLVPVECSCMFDSGGRMYVEIQLAGSRTQLHRSMIVKDISAICGRCFDTPLITQAGTHKRIVLNEIPLYDVEAGAFQHICNNGKLCGDCVNYFSNGFGEFVAMISDGMGTGGRAAVDSNMTVSILSKLLRAGLSENCALQVVNSALMVKSEDESLSTVDMTKIDLFTGKAYFSKAGAPLTYVKKGSSIIRKNATSLPVGILGDVKFSRDKIRLGADDLIVMISDGAICNEDKYIEKILKKSDDMTCSAIAESIVKYAAESRKDSHDDDITAVAIRLSPNN